MQLKGQAVRWGLPGLQSWLCHRASVTLDSALPRCATGKTFQCLSAPLAETADEWHMCPPSLHFAPLADIANQLWSSTQPRDLSGVSSTACSRQTLSIHWCFCARLNHPYAERSRPRSLWFWLLQNSILPPVSTSSPLLQQHQPTWGSLGRTITPPRDVECFFSRHLSELRGLWLQHREDTPSGSGCAGGRNMHQMRLRGGGFPILRKHRVVRPSQISTKGSWPVGRPLGVSILPLEYASNQVCSGWSSALGIRREMGWQRFDRTL